jgi:hypothetical protein
MMTKAKLTLDDQLAKFTDRALDGELTAQDEATLAPDLELRALEETVLRLRDAIPNDDPGEEVVSSMWGEIEKLSNWKAQKPLWQTLKEIFLPRSNWRSRRTRQRWTFAVSITVIAVLLLVILPFMDEISSGLPGASGGQISYQLVFVILGILILLAVWLFRRR